MFTPLKGNSISLYSCGPTVYYFAHIGNMRYFLQVDILKRMFMYESYDVTHIMNITDVGHLVGDTDIGDDKLALTAKKENKSTLEVAEFYTKAFLKDCKLLNILSPTKYTKATDHINDMISLTSILYQKGYLYKLSEGMYFDTSKFKGYGILMGTNFKDLNKSLKAGARVKREEGIRNITDFAVWRIVDTQNNNNFWNTEFGLGFPGWHIECSAMSMKYLGNTIDIHTGGVDHIAIHHTNEIAQSEASTGQKFVNYWFHVEFLTVDGQKMSKSIGNIYTLDDLIKKGYSPSTIRYFLISSHYRQQHNFTFEAIGNSDKTLKNLYNFIETVSQIQNFEKTTDNEFLSEVKKSKDKFFEELRDDLNMPAALACLYNIVNITNKKMSISGISKKESNEIIKSLLEFDKILGIGIKLHISPNEHKLPKEAKDLIEAREQARISKDYKKADELRQILLEKYGVTIDDLPEGPRIHVQGS